MRIKRPIALLLSAVLTLSLCLTLLPKTALAAGPYNVQIGNKDLSGRSDVVYLDVSFNEVAEANAFLQYDPTGTVPCIKVVGPQNDTGSGVSRYHTPIGASNIVAIISATDTSLNLDIVNADGLTLGFPTPGNAQTGIYGIYVPDGTLTITGSNSLTTLECSGKTSDDTYAGIRAKNINIGSGCTVMAKGGLSHDNAYGVYATEALTVSGTLIASGKISASGDGVNRYGAYAGGTLTVKNRGTMTASGVVAKMNCYGAYAGAIAVESGGSLTATGGSVTGNTGEACVSYGVYSAGNMTVNGTLTGTGGTVTLGGGNGNPATSAGVYARGTLTVDNGAVNGTGGAATSQSNDATSYGVYIGGAGSVTGNNGRMTGNAGDSTGSSGSPHAQSVGVHCVGSLTVGSASAAQAAALTGMGGSAKASGASVSVSGNATSVGVRSVAPITVNDGATLTGTGGSAEANINAPKQSVGVGSDSNDITVSGTLNGTSGTLINGNGALVDTSYGVSAGSGTVNLHRSGSMTAIAYGTNTGSSFGVTARGINMSNNSHLIAQVEAAPDVSHAAKPLRVGASENALTTDDTAVWRESRSGAFESIRTYTDSGYYQDKQPRQYLEVKSGGDGLKAAPASLNFDISTKGGTLPNANTVTITNTSGRALTLTVPTPANYTVTLPSTTLAAGASMDITIQPKAATMQTAANYDTTVTLSESVATNPAKVEIPVRFTVSDAPSVSLDANPPIVNSGGQVTLTATATGGSGPYTSYEWSDGTNTWTTTTNTTTANPTVQTSYTVRVQDSNGVWSAFSRARRVDVTGALTIALLPRSVYLVGQCGGDYTVRASDDIGTGRAGIVTVIRMEDGANYSPSLAQGDYVLVSGATLLFLKEAYLNRLPVGTYTLTVGIDGGYYNGQTPSCTFEVAAPGGGLAGDVGPDVPKTGDSAPIAPLCGLVLLSGAGLAIRRKRKARQ